MDLIKRNKSLRLLLTGSSISSFGDYLYDVAVTLLIYDISKSIDAIAAMWISKAALRILILYLGGLITDKFNRKKIITLINLVSAPIALMFMLINESTLWIAYLGVFLLQSLNDIDDCSQNAILPELVQKEDLSKANTVFSFVNQALMLFSFALSGLIYKLAGANILFIINGFSFLLASVFFSFIQYKTDRTASKSTVKLLDTRAFGLLKENHMLVLVLISSALIAVTARIYDVTNILIADSKLNIGSTGIIYFRYAMVIGGFLTPLVLKLKLSNKTYNCYIIFSIMLVLSIVTFALTTHLYAAFIVLILFGFSSSLQGIYFRSLLQENIGTDYLGRVFSFYRIVFTAVSLATVIFIPIANKLMKIEWLYLASGIPIIIFLIAITLTKRNTMIDANVSK